MFDRIQPFELKYIQKASPKEGDAFDFSLIYNFILIGQRSIRD